MIEEETILTLDLQAAWTLYKIKKKDMQEEGTTTETDYKQARHGIHIHFELDDYLQQRFREKPKDQTIIIWKQTYNLTEFRTEIEAREAIIRKALLDYYGEQPDIIKR